ncbi:MAG: RNA-binding protein [Sulfolobales archaeon]
MVVSLDYCSDNVVYIGKKFFMRYVLAVLVKLNLFNCNEAIIKARGSNISKAVLVAESLKELVKEVRYTSIILGSTNIESGGFKRRLSTIKIVISRR